MSNARSPRQRRGWAGTFQALPPRPRCPEKHGRRGTRLRRWEQTARHCLRLGAKGRGWLRCPGVAWRGGTFKLGWRGRCVCVAAWARVPSSAGGGAARSAGGGAEEVGLYVMDIDGSRLIRLAGDEPFPARVEAPVGLGPELPPESLDQIAEIMSSKVPGANVLARALQLEDAERAHLFDLARAAQPTPARPRRRQGKQRVRPEIQWSLDAITGAAAFVSNERLDILAANQLGRALCLGALRRAGAAGQHRPVRLPRSARQRRPTATGTASPRNPSPSCARPRAATHTTATSQTSSASSQHRARRSAPAGPRTTSASTTPASSTSTIPSSATST